MGKKLRILIADDSETDVQLLLRTLRAGGLAPEYERVDTAEGTQAALDSGPWDIMLCDYTMPQFGALDALRIVQREDADLPVIIISGTIGEDVAVAAMRAGARDYLMKGRLDRLNATIERELRSAEEWRAHKLAKAGLIESEERYRRLFESAKDGILLLDFETGKITDANPFMTELLGYSRGAFIGKYLWEVGLFKDTLEAKKDFLKLQTTSYIRYADLPLETKDGKKAPVEFVSNVYQAGGKKVIQCNIRDISERKQAEEALRESESKYRTLIETTGTGYLILDNKGLVVDANKEYLRLSGHKELREILGKSVVEWTAERDKRKNAKAVEKCVKDGFVRDLTIDYVDNDGRVTPVEINATVAGKGETARVISLCRDISKRKQAEEALRDSEQKLRLAQELGRIGSWEFDIGNRATFWSNEMYALYERDPKSGPPTPEEEARYYSPEQAKTLRDHAARAIETGKEQAYDFKARFPGGRTADFSSVVRPVKDANGRVVKLSGTVQDITERTKSEEALKLDSEIFNNMTEGVYLVGADDGVIKYTNPRFEKMFGYEAGELVGKDVSIVNAPSGKTPEETKNEILDIIKRTGEWHGDIENIRKDGARFWCFAHATNFRHPAFGQVCINVHTDITARKNAEAALIESEARYRTLFNQARDSILVLELQPDGVPVVRDANDAALRLRGYSREEILGKPITFLDAEQSASLVRDRIRRIQSSKSVVMEVRHRRKDGSVIDLEAAVMEMTIGDKHMLLDTSRDITDRKKAANDLSESYKMQVMLNTLRKESLAALPLQNKLVAHLATLLSMPWLAVEPKGAVFLVTGEFLVLTVQQGLAPALQTSCAKVPFGKCLCGRTAESGKVVTSTGVGPKHEITYEGMIPHGHYCAPITAAGATLGVLNLYLQAGTELTMKQKDFIQSATDVIASDILHARVEDQLVQSQKMEAVGQLAGGVAHDFNNILMAIMGYSEFIRAALPAGDPKLADVEQVLLAGERAAVLTQQLLTFSRKQVVQFSELNLDDIVPGTLKMLRRMLPENIEFRTSFNSAPAKVPANRGQLEQVVLNLAVNARDAMPDGGTLTFETAPAELDADYAASHPGIVPGHYVMLAVSDTGCGMSPDVVARIFEPFFTTKEKSKGTGLGLSTVYGIVRQSGGSIYVYSEPGKGTTFKVYLPIAVENTENKPAEKPALSTYRGTETILLVEDDAAVRKFVFRALSQNGYNVLQAATPGEAVQQCELRKDIQLMFTDMVMPQMNGYELSKVVTAMLPGMKVVFMSGYTDNALNRKDLGPGVVLLEKPLKVETILRTAREILKGESQ